MTQKSLILATMILLLITLSTIANGQNKVSLTSGGFIVVGGESPGTPLSTEAPGGRPVAAQIHFGDVSPAANGSRRIVKLPIQISAKVNYKVEFQRFSLNDNSVKPSDIGFGITNIRQQKTGSNRPININAGKFLNDPASSPIINGKPRFATTLNDIGESPTLILSGTPTNKLNEEDEDDRHESEGATTILVDLVFVLSAQYYDPNKPFNLRLNMTISPR